MMKRHSVTRRLPGGAIVTHHLPGGHDQKTHGGDSHGGEVSESPPRVTPRQFRGLGERKIARMLRSDPSISTRVMWEPQLFVNEVWKGKQAGKKYPEQVEMLYARYVREG